MLDARPRLWPICYASKFGLYTHYLQWSDSGYAALLLRQGTSRCLLQIGRVAPCNYALGTTDACVNSPRPPQSHLIATQCQIEVTGPCLNTVAVDCWLRSHWIGFLFWECLQGLVVQLFAGSCCITLDDITRSSCLIKLR